jgi:hypothetical protein
MFINECKIDQLELTFENYDAFWIPEKSFQFWTISTFFRSEPCPKKFKTCAVACALLIFAKVNK